MHNGPHTHGILSTPYTSRQRQPARKWFSSDSAVQRPWERLKLEWHEVERISCVCRPLCVCIRMPACLCVRIRLGLSRHAASRLTENGRKGKRQRTGERGGGCGKGTAAGSRSGRWEWNLQRTKAETEKAKKRRKYRLVVCPGWCCFALTLPLLLALSRLLLRRTLCYSKNVPRFELEKTRPFQAPFEKEKDDEREGLWPKNNYQPACLAHLASSLLDYLSTAKIFETECGRMYREQCGQLTMLFLLLSLRLLRRCAFCCYCFNGLSRSARTIRRCHNE